MFSKRIREASTKTVNRLKAYAWNRTRQYESVAVFRGANLELSLGPTASPVSNGIVIDPANIPLPDGLKLVPPPHIPELTPRFKHVQPSQPITAGLAGYNAIAYAETWEEAKLAASWGVKFGNTKAVEAGLREWERRNQPEPEPSAMEETREIPKITIGEALLDEFGNKPYLCDLFIPDLELVTV